MGRYSRQSDSDSDRRRSRKSKHHKKSKARYYRRSRSSSRNRKSKKERRRSRSSSRDRFGRRRKNDKFGRSGRSKSSSSSSSSSESVPSPKEYIKEYQSSKRSSSVESLPLSPKRKQSSPTVVVNSTKKTPRVVKNTNKELPEIKIKELPDQLSVSQQIAKAETLQTITSDGFTQQPFRSTRSEKDETPQVAGNGEFTFGTAGERRPAQDIAKLGVLAEGGVVHPNLFLNQEQKEEKWIKKLFNIRQKYLQGEAIS